MSLHQLRATNCDEWYAIIRYSIDLDAHGRKEVTIYDVEPEGHVPQGSEWLREFADEYLENHYDEFIEEAGH